MTNNISDKAYIGNNVTFKDTCDKRADVAALLP